jgi:hypothetical protein
MQEGQNATSGHAGYTRSLFGSCLLFVAAKNDNHRRRLNSPIYLEVHSRTVANNHRHGRRSTQVRYQKLPRRLNVG